MFVVVASDNGGILVDSSVRIAGNSLLIDAVGRVCTAPTNDLLPISYSSVVAKDTVVVHSMHCLYRAYRRSAHLL